MKRHAKRTIRQRIRTFSLFLVLTTAGLGMTTTLLFSLYMEYQNMDRNLMNSAQVLAQSPKVADVLADRSSNATLTRYLNSTISRVQDIDVIVVVDREGFIRYSPLSSQIGMRYPDYHSLPVFHGESIHVDTGAGISQVERRAMASVSDADGAFLGFVSVGIGVRSVSRLVYGIAGGFLALTALAAGAALLLSRRLAGSIKGALMGYEPDAFRRLFLLREDILETLEEGILAIDQAARITYMNSACLHMFHAEKLSDVQGRPLLEIYPNSRLPRLLTTKKAEYNVHLHKMPGAQAVISDRMPIWEDGELVGAVAIFRDRTEVTNLAEELTGSRHLVDALRAYTHEFLNKLHTILGLIQLGRPEEAEQYIMNISQVHHQSVSRVMNQIEDTAVAALLVGKSSRAAELGIHLQLDPKSVLSGEEHVLPSGVLVTILGNLIENAAESLGRSTRKQKEIHVSVVEQAEGLFLCVEDTGPGIVPELLPHIFEPGISTKGTGRGIGLAQIKELTDLYHGTIRVESEPKAGTSFFLHFPSHPSLVQPKDRTSDQTLPSGADSC